MQTKLDIRGLREVAKGLEQFKKSTQTGVLTRALKRAAKPVENAARNYAPVDEAGNFRADQWVVRGFNNGDSQVDVRAWVTCAKVAN